MEYTLYLIGEIYLQVVMPKQINPHFYNFYIIKTQNNRSIKKVNYRLFSSFVAFLVSTDFHNIY